MSDNQQIIPREYDEYEYLRQSTPTGLLLTSHPQEQLTEEQQKEKKEKDDLWSAYIGEMKEKGKW